MFACRLNKQLEQSERLFNKAVGKAEVAFRRDDLCSVVAWAQVAGHLAFVRHPGFFVSSALETLLIEVSKKLKEKRIKGLIPKINSNDSTKMRFLHVITEGYSTGGHLPFIARWIENTSQNSVHSLVATSHTGPLPEFLKNSVAQSGGNYISLPSLSNNLLERALILRQIARNWADAIVLFIHPFDGLPIVSFGIDGGPPVIFCNHADHVFWLGASIADVVANYHSSGIRLCEKRRGIYDNKILPIPLLKTDKKNTDISSKRWLGLLNENVMLLTVGRYDKFLPFAGYDFLDAIVKVLRRHPEAKLFAVGPSHEGRWRKASEAVGGRIKAVGTIKQPLLRKYYETADLYVTSFPCGSGTAMLEAGMLNVPIIGLQLNELPHLSEGDDVAFEKSIVHSSSLFEFEKNLDFAIDNKVLFRRSAYSIKENIEREHCPPIWNNYLDGLLQSLPSQHMVRKPERFCSAKDYSDLYLAQLDSEMLSNELTEHTFERLVRVYSQYLKKGDCFKEQTMCFLEAIPKVDSLEKVKQYLYNLREFAAHFKCIIK